MVSHGEVEFKVDLRFKDCGEPGLYGRRQRDWYLSERGLMWAEEYDGSQHPKEPTTGFQLFSTRPLNKILKDSANDSRQREEEINALFFDPNFTGKEVISLFMHFFVPCPEIRGVQNSLTFGISMIGQNL